MTERGFIKFDLILLSLFSALMAFLFYAGVDSISFSNNDIRTFLNEVSLTEQNDAQDDLGIKERLSTPAKLIVIPRTMPTLTATDKQTPQQHILDLQVQVAQLTLQLQQIEPAAAQETPDRECERQSQTDAPSIPAMKKITPQTEQKASVATPAQATPSAKKTVKPALVAKPARPIHSAKHTQHNKTSTQQQNHLLHDKAWLLSQKDSHYSMQILAVRSKQELLQEIKKSNLEQGELAYYPIIRNGHVWYALLYGLFEHRADAQQAIKKLPTHLRQNKPWLRSLRAIKKAIQQVPIETQ
ncbi:MAG: SPOR domain-containing protein [Gammaproteobacteria bacterium]|nr:SPOR domain-containing protein [Gammaproteobacteria bacterium]